MIISKTPFRVSLAGGGSDLPDYYMHRPGHVVTMAINRYMYVTVNRRFDDSIRVSYTQTEIVERVDDLQHDLIREALKMAGVVSGVEVTTIADLPAGIGLGSSSALAVGVLNALYALKGEWHPPERLAERACQIEIEVLGKPIGKQDQYVAAFGGLQDIRFHSDGRVAVHPVVCAGAVRAQLGDSLLLFFTGLQRDAGSVLAEARRRLVETPEAMARIDCLVKVAANVRRCLIDGNTQELGRLLDGAWRVKKEMAANVSNDDLDALYLRALDAGAEGGKISGAGGGGCLLLYVQPDAHASVREAMTNAGVREVHFSLEPEGSRIIHYAD